MNLYFLFNVRGASDPFVLVLVIGFWTSKAPHRDVMTLLYKVHVTVIPCRGFLPLPQGED
jgi:hypothetical protein